MEGLIEQKVNGIMIFPTDPVALRGVVDKAVAKGIKVAFLNGSIENTKCVFQAGTDNYALGKVCGEKMVKLMNGKGKIVVQTGTIGMSALDDRVRGFRDALKGSAIQEVAFQANEDNMEKSVEMVNTYLSAHPEVDGYFIDGGWPFFSPPEALPELQKFRDRGGIFGIVDTFYPMLKYMDRRSRGGLHDRPELHGNSDPHDVFPAHRREDQGQGLLHQRGGMHEGQREAAPGQQEALGQLDRSLS